MWCRFWHQKLTHICTFGSKNGRERSPYFLRQWNMFLASFWYMSHLANCCDSPALSGSSLKNVSGLLHKPRPPPLAPMYWAASARVKKTRKSKKTRCYIKMLTIQCAPWLNSYSYQVWSYLNHICGYGFGFPMNIRDFMYNFTFSSLHICSNTWICWQSDTI